MTEKTMHDEFWEAQHKLGGDFGSEHNELKAQAMAKSKAPAKEEPKLEEKEEVKALPLKKELQF